MLLFLGIPHKRPKPTEDVQLIEPRIQVVDDEPEICDYQLFGPKAAPGGTEKSGKSESRVEEVLTERGPGRQG